MSRRNSSIIASLAVIILFISLSSPCASAKGIIKGVVIDYVTREPLIDANIYIRELNTGISTDIDGRFRLEIGTPLNTEMEISFVGYETKVVKIELGEGEEKEYTIYLNPGAEMLETINVTGSKIKETTFSSTNFITVTSEEKISTSAYTTTADVLMEEPGIIIQKTTHGHGTPIIRGLIGRQVVLLYNGIRLNRPNFRVGGNQYMDTINPESLSSIEITRGPTSVLYGSDAIGGSVNMIPRIYESAGPGFKFFPGIRFDYSTADNGRNATLLFRGSLDELSYSGNIAYKKIGDLDPGGNAIKQDPTGWEELDGNLNLFFEPSEVHTFEFNYINVNQNEVPRYDKYADGSYGKYIYDPQNRRLYALTYNFSPAYSWLHQVKWNVSYQEEEEGRIKQKPASSKITTENDKFKTYGTYLNFSSVYGKKHWLTWGGEYYFDKLKSSAYYVKDGLKTISPQGAYPDDSEYTSSGLYIQDIFIIDPKLELRGGLRYSHVSFISPEVVNFGEVEDDFSDLSGFAGMLFKLRPDLNLVASYARGFRAPNFNDTVVLKESGTGYDAPSPGLTQELSHNFEIGLKKESDSFQGSIFGFYSYLNDLIIRRDGTFLGMPFYDDNGNGIWDEYEAPIKQKFNSGKAAIYGVESFGSYRFSDHSVRGQLFYTYGEQENIDADTDEAFTEPMRRIPPLTGMLAYRWEGSEKWWLEANTFFAGKQDRLSLDDLDDSRIPDGGTPGYAVINLKGMYRFEYGRVVLGLENIFDELYKTHGSGIYFAGRQITVSLQLSPLDRE
ncbi:TonB-dependent receptor domain-containing protein [candidate division KSB1 bacterium]